MKFIALITVLLGTFAVAPQSEIGYQLLTIDHLDQPVMIPESLISFDIALEKLASIEWISPGPERNTLLVIS